MVRNAIRIVTVSEFSRVEIAKHLGASSDGIAVVSEGADHMDSIVAEPEILAANGLTNGGFILVVGNLAAHKNLAALSDLALLLAQRGIPLVVIGGIAPEVFQGDGKARLPHPARYLGRVSDGALKALYEAATCFVVPSLYEGFGLPAIEAMACSCPVVASNIPALRETCGDAALFCNPASPRDIAMQVGCVIDDAGVRERLRNAGRLRAGALTWDRAGRALDKVVETVASSKKMQ